MKDHGSNMRAVAYLFAWEAMPSGTHKEHLLVSPIAEQVDVMLDMIL